MSGRTPDRLLETQARELLAAAAPRHRVPGAQLGLLRGRERVVITHGTRRDGADLPVTPDTRFHAGSIAKALAAQLVLEAESRGELDLDAPCSGQADVDWDDTPRALMSQTSGRPNELPGGDDSLAGFCARVATMGRLHAPGRFSYCNAGWSVLDLVLRERSGAGFAERVVERGPHRCTGRQRGGVRGVLRRDRGDSAAGAVWWATADELLALAARQLRPDGRQDDPALVAAMQQPTARVPGATVGDAWGLGWMVWEQPRAFGWAGFTGGHRAYLRCFPDQDAALVLLGNAAGPLFGPPGGSALFDDLLDDLLDLLDVPVPATADATAPQFAPDTRPGQYGPVTVSEGTSGLLVDGRMLGGAAEHRLTAAYGDTWVVDGGPPGSIPLAFSGDEGAEVPAFLYLGPFAMPRLA